MGAYENPETFIDTQTPKYIQGLQETIAGSFANVAQSYAAKQVELRKKREETEKKRIIRISPYFRNLRCMRPRLLERCPLLWWRRAAQTALFQSSSTRPAMPSHLRLR